MDPMQQFGAYAADFEKTFEDDDWSRLEGYFAEDATYTVTGSPYDCELRGRAAVLEGLKKALDGFDRRFDTRVISAAGQPEVGDNHVVFPAQCDYEKSGLPPLSFGLTETAEFDAAGRIVALRDDYPDGQEDVAQWLEANKAAFDPRYT